MPSDKAGTSNYWSHLWTHHRLVWYELKQRDGTLNPAGEAAMAKLKEGLANMAAGTYQQRKTSEGLRMPPPLRRSCVVSVIPDMVNNIGYPRYGERYDIGDNQYSSNNLSYCPINRFLESISNLNQNSERTRNCQRLSHDGQSYCNTQDCAFPAYDAMMSAKTLELICSSGPESRVVPVRGPCP